MKSFRQHISEAELKTRIDKVSGGRFLVMKWNTGRRGWYQDGKPFKTEKEDRKSTRLNSSHKPISYAVFCLKKKKK